MSVVMHKLQWHKYGNYLRNSQIIPKPCRDYLHNDLPGETTHKKSLRINGHCSWHSFCELSSDEHFIVAVWRQDKCIEADEASYDGHGWSIHGYDGDVCDLDRSTRVPEPGTLLLLGSGLVTVAIFRKRMKA